MNIIFPAKWLGGNCMEQAYFAELVESVKEGANILRGEKEASRTFYLEPMAIKNIKDGDDSTQD
jgi:hypothetical protein